MEGLKNISENKKESALKTYFRKHSFKFLILILSFLSYNDTEAQKVDILKNNTEIENIDLYETQKKSYSLEDKKDFKEFYSLLKENQTFEKLKNLEDKFGFAINNFLEMHFIKSDIYLFKNVRENQDNTKTFEEEDSRFITKSSLLSRAFNRRWINKDKVLRETTAVKFGGLEEVSNLTESEVSKYLRDRYPEGYINNSIDSIRYENKLNDSEGGVIKIGESETYGLPFLLKNKGNLKKDIIIYDAPSGLDKQFFLEILNHEVHHPNDWNNNLDLSSFDRINMLYDFSNRINAEDRYISFYVEEITKNQLDFRLKNYKGISEDDLDKSILYIKTMEYFPEVMKAYFNDKDTLKKNNPIDYELADKWTNIISNLNK